MLTDTITRDAVDEFLGLIEFAAQSLTESTAYLSNIQSEIMNCTQEICNRLQIDEQRYALHDLPPEGQVYCDVCGQLGFILHMIRIPAIGYMCAESCRRTSC